LEHKTRVLFRVGAIVPSFYSEESSYRDSNLARKTFEMSFLEEEKTWFSSSSLVVELVVESRSSREKDKEDERTCSMKKCTQYIHPFVRERVHKPRSN
jgi:hypothetical protein